MDGNPSRTSFPMLLAVPAERRLGYLSALNWRRCAQQLQKRGYLFYFVFKHQRTPWYSRLIAACCAGYVLSPIQLIPNFIPVIGWLDDVLVLLLGMKILQKITPAEILAECRDLAEAACNHKRNDLKWAVIAPIILITAWLLVTLATTVFAATYF